MVVNNAVSFLQNNIQNYRIVSFLCECEILHLGQQKYTKNILQFLFCWILEFQINSLVATEIDALNTVLKMTGEKKNDKNCLTVVLFE